MNSIKLLNELENNRKWKNKHIIEKRKELKKEKKIDFIQQNWNYFFNDNNLSNKYKIIN